MTGFFVAVILFGGFITAMAMVLIVAEKSHERDMRLDVTERRDRLVDVMADAEQLVEELNRFADYSVGVCEQKRQEVVSVLQQADMLMSQVSAASASLASSIAGARAAASQSPSSDLEEPSLPMDRQPATAPQDIGLDAMDRVAATAPVGQTGNGVASRGRVLTLDARRSEALRLATGGMTHAEIARSLHLGKGEIELITRVGSGT